MDYYQILEVDQAASPEVIKRAYRVLTMKYHPDHNASLDNPERIHQINEAYRVLSDAGRRRAYDDSRVSWDVWLDDGVIGLVRNWLTSASTK